MSAQELGLGAIYDLAKKVMLANGCDTANAADVAETGGSSVRSG